MNEEDLKNTSRKLLDEHAEDLDGATLSKLHQARNRAVAGRPRYKQVMPWAGGAVAAGLAIAVLYLPVAAPPLPDIYEDPLQQAAAEELDLMDDLEFMAWLVLEEDLSADAGENT